MKSRCLALAAIAGVVAWSSCSEDDVAQPEPEPLPEDPPQYVLQWGSVGSGQGEFRDPWDVAVDNDGNVYVADRTNHRIQKFDGDGNFLLAWGTPGTGDGQFDYPEGVAVDTTDTVFVADIGNQRVQVFDSDGNYAREWSVNVPSAIAVDLGRDVYVVTQWYSVAKFDAFGNHRFTFGGEDDGSHDPGRFDVVGGVATDSSGNVYATDQLNNRVQRFNGNGGFMIMWGSRGSGNGEFVGPIGVAIDGKRDVYVVDYKNYRVQKFTQFGQFLTRWGSQGDGNGQFSLPVGIAVDTAGNIFVADMNNNRIQKFR
jgi:DNA-binding beta-propeller fold protein YncE